MSEIPNDSKGDGDDSVTDDCDLKNPSIAFQTPDGLEDSWKGSNRCRNKHSCSAAGTEDNDEEDSDHTDEGSGVDRLDFTRLRVRGREEQIARLHQIYRFVHNRGLGRKMNKQKGETSVAIVGGSSGTGKSTLVKQFVDELREKSRLPGASCVPFFIDGKYDELAGADPFSGIVEAFNGFAKGLMEGDVHELRRIRACIQVQLGSETTTLTTLIPGLKAVIQDEAMIKGSRENARNKLKYIFQTFVSAISTQQRPVILFLDDLQWCDSASLELIVALLTDLDMRHFMFIGSYRTDEVGKDDELIKCFEVVNNIQPIANIEVNALSKDELNLLLCDALQRQNKGDTMELTEVIHKRTMGNIFHSIQVLEQLQRKEILSFSRLTFQWEWKLEDADLENFLLEDVIQVVTGKIANAHPDLQRILVLAAYTRSTVDVNTLAPLTDINGPLVSPEDLLRLLDKAVVEGLLTNNVGSRLYSFGHDRIQEAAYEMIPPGRERDNLRSRLGLKLYEMGMGSHGEDWVLFLAADHLNATANLNNDDPIFLITVNLEVADRASSVAAYQYALKYLGEARRSLLAMNDPWEEHYCVTLRVFRATAEAELCLGHFDVGMAAGHSVIDRARCLDDKMPTYLAICKAIGREQRHKEASELSFDVLHSMGAIPKRGIGLKMHLIRDFLYLKRFFSKHTDAEILALPLMENSRLATIMELLSVASYHAYYCGAMLDFLAGVSRMLVVSLKNGHSPCCGTAMMGFSLFSNAVNDMKASHRFSHLAREILRLTQAREEQCLQIFVITHFVYAWKDPADQIIELYEGAHKIGMESGDFENALLSQVSGYHHAFVAGHSLPVLEMKYASVMEKLDLYNMQFVRGFAVEHLLPIQHLRGTGNHHFESALLSTFGPTGAMDNASEYFRLTYGYLGRLQLAVYFNDDDFAVHTLRELERLAPGSDTGFGIKSVRICFSSLAYATLYRKLRRRSYLRKSRWYLRQLKGFCQSKGTSCWHRCALMEAHLLATQGKNPTIVSTAYDHAIGAASRNGHDHDAALASQLAAEYCLSVLQRHPANSTEMYSLENMARNYLGRARELYLSWGAVALVNHLEERHRPYFERCYGSRMNSNELTSVNPSSQSSRSDTNPRITWVPGSQISSDIVQETTEDISVLTLETHFSPWRPSIDDGDQ